MSEAASTVLDSGALIAVERRAASMRAFIEEAEHEQAAVVVPAPVLAQVWRGGIRQALLARFLNLAFVEVDVLTRSSWQAVGVLCGATGTRDVVDAAVVICARERNARVVITSDPDDLRHLDGKLVLRMP